jgi:hypothetical protein
VQRGIEPLCHPRPDLGQRRTYAGGGAKRGRGGGFSEAAVFKRFEALRLRVGAWKLHF